MDAETIRQQIFDEVQTQFDDKLREMRRMKSKVEEEFENASDQWRAERRRLRSEIDRLESDLEAANKRPNETRDDSVSSDEIGKVQKAFEDKLKKAEADWAVERDRLKQQNAKLGHSLAEAIEQSSNPIRSTQPITDHFEAKLMDSTNQRLDIEQEYLRAKAIWAEEKRKLSGEVFRLRRFAPDAGLAIQERSDQLSNRKASLEEVRIQELETQLTEARAEVHKYHEVASKSGKELAALGKELRTLQQKLADRQGSDSADFVEQLRREYDEKIRELGQQMAQAEKGVDITTMTESETAPVANEKSKQKSSTTSAVSAVNDEVARVEKLIQEIDKLADDPNIELSTIHQKNAEKAELDSYLRGLLYSQNGVKP